MMMIYFKTHQDKIESLTNLYLNFEAPQIKFKFDVMILACRLGDVSRKLD